MVSTGLRILSYTLVKKVLPPSTDLVSSSDEEMPRTLTESDLLAIAEVLSSSLTLLFSSSREVTLLVREVTSPSSFSTFCRASVSFELTFFSSSLWLLRSVRILSILSLRSEMACLVAMVLWSLSSVVVRIQSEKMRNCVWWCTRRCIERGGGGQHH